MPANYYGDESDQPAAEEKPGQDGGDGQDNQDDAGHTAMLPKSFLGDDVEPGHRCTVEVVRVHGDDCEVKYVDEDEEEKGEGEKDGPTMEGAMSKLDDMASDKG